MYAKAMDEDEAAVWLDEELDSVAKVPTSCAPTTAAGILSGC